MPIPINLELYNIIKKEADRIYSKPSAYKSGYIVKEYKKRGGEYSGKKTNTGLTRWYKEQWKDIGKKSYPVYRPTKRITKDTPLTADEIDPVQAVKQIALKQKIRGSKNLPKFEGGADDPTTPPSTPPRRRQRDEPTPPQRQRIRTEEPQQPTIIAPPLFQNIPNAPNQAPLQFQTSWSLPTPLSTQLPPLLPRSVPIVLPDQSVFQQPQLISDLLYLPSPRSIADLHFTGEGRKPDEFKQSIQHVFDLLAIRGKFNIIGSASNDEILYYSDFDLATFEKVSLQSIKKIFQNKFKEAQKDPTIFITDFKCGEVNGEPVRWNKKNIKTERQIINGKEITLDECLLMPSTIKMDIIALIDGDFVEFSDNYYLSVNGVKNYDDEEVSNNVLLKELEKSAKEYYNEPNYFKYLKRVFSIKTIQGQSTKKLVDFFNSQVGLLNKSKTDLETLILVFDNCCRKPKLKDICNNIQIIKQNISGVSEVEFKSTLYKDLDKICSYKNQTSIIKNLKKVINYIQKKVNQTTLEFIKKNKI
nr:MAG: hypothetical protein [Lake Baikal virophage 10]